MTKRCRTIYPPTQAIEPKLRPSESKYGFHTTASQNDPLTQILRQGSRSSGRKVTLVRIPKGKSDGMD